MERLLLSVAFLCMCVCGLSGQTSRVYFPEGMSWKEVGAEPGSPLDTTQCRFYEIGADTLIGGVTYGRVLVDGSAARGLFVRENGDEVWLLCPEYAGELKLYDFSWPVAGRYVTDFLTVSEDGSVELSSYECPSSYGHTEFSGKSYDYLYDFSRVQVRGLGNVSELDRDASLLGYMVEEPVVPGLIYQKVLWVRRGGEEVFRSEDSEEWTEMVPSDIYEPPYIECRGIPDIFDIQGRRLSAPPSHGVYIQGGRKLVR